ncbi:unnamed protein product [Phytophthora fragariaefolia]|uniref:Unnamed protein product n=1 Tax=Phytophthora fragariaefolia TaxID=1490495 RepID=A0A9W6YF93_9STRA|nr:unnamed protein product [Phytophthora fragariaefolia]
MTLVRNRYRVERQLARTTYGGVFLAAESEDSDPIGFEGLAKRKGNAVVSTVVDTQVEQEWPVTEGSDLGASAPGADAIGPNIKGRSAVRRQGKRGASAPGADTASSSDGCKRPAPEMLACSRAAGRHDEAEHNQAGLNCVCPRGDPAGDQNKDLSTAGPGQNKTRGTGLRTRSERRKRAKLRKARSGTETLEAVYTG